MKLELRTFFLSPELKRNILNTIHLLECLFKRIFFYYLQHYKIFEYNATFII